MASNPSRELRGAAGAGGREHRSAHTVPADITFSGDPTLIINRVIPTGHFIIEHSTTLAAGDWQSPDPMTFDETIDDFMMPAPAADGDRRFYRVRWVFEP